MGIQVENTVGYNSSACEYDHVFFVNVRMAT